ncbi:G-protein coupled receptor 151 [Mustelus asterias]
MEKVPVQANHFSSNGSEGAAHWAGGYQDIHSKELRVAIPVTLAGICLVGFAGNFLVFAVLINNARRGKTSMINSLILNLSVADLLLLLLSAPLRALALSSSAWTLGWFVCKSADWFLHSCLASKSFTTAVLAKACFMYVSHPSKAVQIRHRRIAALLAAIWALALLLPSPQWLCASLQVGPGGQLACVCRPAGSTLQVVFAKLYPVLVYCVPLLCTFLYHCRALRRCRRRASKSHNPRSHARASRLTLMLFSSSLAFAALCAPEWLVWLWLRHSGSGHAAAPPALALLAQVLLFSLSSVQPLIFVALSEEFKEGFLALWKGLVAGQPPRASPAAAASSQRRQSSTPAPVPAPVPDRLEKSVQVPEPDKAESPASKTANLVLTDMEQFWHDRQNTAAAAGEDPIPWEHQEGSACPEGSAKM